MEDMREAGFFKGDPYGRSWKKADRLNWTNTDRPKEVDREHISMDRQEGRESSSLYMVDLGLLKKGCGTISETFDSLNNSSNATKSI